MSIDVALSRLAETIESDQPWPRPACPSCQTGYIRFTKPDEDEDYSSASLHDHPGFDPDWITGTFVVRGQCENPDCQQAMHGAGDYRVDYSRHSIDDEYQGIDYSAYYTIKSLHPPTLIMPIPKSAPEVVREGVLRASRVLFADPGLAATALRTTVELFLTSQGVSATRPKGGFRPVDERIVEWRDGAPSRLPIADLLVAVKWLGNAGTHEDSHLTTTDVLDGARMLDEAFHRLFTGPDIDTYAQAVNAVKGPFRASSGATFSGRDGRAQPGSR